MNEAEVLLPADVFGTMVAAGRGALPHESGGFLAGYRVDSTIVVTRAVVVPDERSSARVYVRRRGAAADLLTELRVNAPEVIGYVGEWHVHPADMPPSATDVATLGQAALVAGGDVALVVLPFIGPQAQPPVALVGRRVRRRRAAVFRATARTTSTSAAELETAAQQSLRDRGDHMIADAEPTRPFDIRATFHGQTATMAAEFEKVRAATAHGPTVGDGAEEAWRSMLAGFLPRRYAVTKGFVVDSCGHSSEQIDAIIHDRHFSPVLYATAGVMFVPAESVYAVFEIKQEVSKATIGYAGKKAESVRRLHRTSAPIRQLSQASAMKEPPRVLAGILAGRNGWQSRFDAPLISALEGLAPDQRLDLGCVIDTGTFEIPEDEVPSAAEFASQDVGLAMFAMRLIARLNAMGTIPAMDIDAYTEPLLRAAGQPAG